jgi:hypothetical protein
MPPSADTGFAKVVRRSIEGHGNDQLARIEEWVSQMSVPPQQEVFVSWNSLEAVVTTWELIIKYWNTFWYPGGDDMVVFDASLAWALFISHEEEAFFRSMSA